MVSPVARDIVFVESVSAHGRGLIEYLEFKNRTVDDRINELENRKLLLGERNL
jgi:hypothetical protein